MQPFTAITVVALYSWKHSSAIVKKDLSPYRALNQLAISTDREINDIDLPLSLKFNFVVLTNRLFAIENKPDVNNLFHNGVLVKSPSGSLSKSS